MRIFIAIRLADEMKRSIVGYMDGLKKSGFKANYTRSENLHLTLAFIGETKELEKIQSAVREIRFEPFEVKTGKLGNFRDILWLGVDQEKRLSDISEKLQDALGRHGIRFDSKPFKAHITLARKIRIGKGDLPDMPQCSAVVDRISVMKSERVDGRLVYTEMQYAPAVQPGQCRRKEIPGAFSGIVGISEPLC